MIQSNTERNFSLGTFADRLYKQSHSQFSYANEKQPMPSSFSLDDIVD